MIKVKTGWVEINLSANRPGLRSQSATISYHVSSPHSFPMSIQSPNEESVSFKGNTIEEAELKCRMILKGLKELKKIRNSHLETKNR